MLKDYASKNVFNGAREITEDRLAKLRADYRRTQRRQKISSSALIKRLNDAEDPYDDEFLAN